MITLMVRATFHLCSSELHYIFNKKFLGSVFEAEEGSFILQKDASVV